MSRAAFTAGFLIIFATASGAENYCPESRFTEFASGEINDGDFHVGYTSGYQIDAQGQLMFRRCISNLHEAAWVHFRWNGPRPDPIFKGRLARSNTSSGRALVEEWKSSTTGPEIDVRKLELSLDSSGNFENFDVDTWFEKAEAADTQIYLVQQAATLDFDSAEEFISSMRALMQGIDRPRFRLSSGVAFDMPPEPAGWQDFILGNGDGAGENLVRVLVSAGIEYDPETLEITLDMALGFDDTAYSTGWSDQLFEGISVEFEGLSDLGLENVGPVDFQTSSELVPLGPDLIGRRQLAVLGSLSDFETDARPLIIADVPITVRLRGAEIFRFHVEAIAPPSTL